MKIDGAAIAHQEFDFGHRGGRIDAVDDGAERLRRHVADHPFLAGIAHDGDAVALAGRASAKARAARAPRGVAAPGVFAIEAEMFAR